jgi:hypothetical protein
VYEALFVDLFLEAHERPLKQIILDLDATDDRLHGHQEGFQDGSVPLSWPSCPVTACPVTF